MNGQQLQLPTYQQISGAVQLPLVMLVWCALLLFFGYQYQANALLPKNDALGSQVTLDAQTVLLAQQRSDRLLAELAAQAPVDLPKLMDRQDFGQDLAAALAGSTLGRGDWQPHSTTKPVAPSKSRAAAAAKLQAKPSSFAKSPSEPVVPNRVAPENTASKHAAKAAAKSAPKAAKFVRLPAAVNHQIRAQADPLRASKDRSREDLRAGRISIAYRRLRSTVAQGRTDIEYLGLLALASLQQHPDEAEVIYRHLMQLQPDTKRWQQGLDHSLQLLAARVRVLPNTNLSSANDMRTAPAAG